MNSYNLIGPDAVQRVADFRLELEVKDNGVARDLTGWGFEFVIANGRQKLVVASTANGKITVPSPTNGKLFVGVLKSDMDGVSDGVYNYYCVGMNGPMTELILEDAKIEIR